MTELFQFKLLEIYKPKRFNKLNINKKMVPKHKRAGEKCKLFTPRLRREKILPQRDKKHVLHEKFIWGLTEALQSMGTSPAQ